MMSSYSMLLSATENTLFWFNIALKSAALLGIAAMVCRFLRNRSAAVRHRVWTVAVVVSLLLPIAIMILPQISLPILPSQNVSPTAAPGVVDAAAVQPAQLSEAMRAHPMRPLLNPRDLQSAVGGEKNDIQSTPSEKPRGNSIETAMIPPEARKASPPQSTEAESVLLGIWTLGALLVAVPFLCLRFIQWLRHRQETPILDPVWNACVADHAHQLGLSRVVRLFSSPRGTVPAVHGVLRPYLVLPENYRKWSDEMRRCVLLHELAHVKRRDLATQFLGQLTAALYWFNPLAWYALRQLRIERELACDDCVLLAGERASNYAQQLLNMLRMYRVERLASGVAMSHTARLDQRVLAVLDRTRCRFPVSRGWGSFSSLTAVLLAGLLGAVSIAARSATAESSKSIVIEKKSLDSQNTSPTADSPPHTEMKFSGVVLQGQKPVAGATVTLWQRIGPDGFYINWHPREKLDVQPRQLAVSDKNGNFEFSFSTQEMQDTPWNIWNNWIKPWHQVQVVVSKEGMGVGWCNLEQLQKRQKIWIRGTVPLTGKIVDLQGRPVEGCRVRFFSLSDGKSGHVALWQPTWTGLSQDVVTDADGQFVMRGLPKNRKHVRLYVSGPSIATKIFSLDMGEKEQPPVEVIVEPTKPIVGVVRDLETDQPVSGVVVYGSEEKTHRLVRAVTDERGEYRLEGLPKAGQYQLTTYSPFSKGYLTRYTAAVDTPGLEPIQHNIPLRRGIPVHVTVIDKRTRQRLQPEVHYVPTNDNPLHREATRELYSPKDEYRRIHAADENGVVRFVAYPGRGLINVTLQGGIYLPVGYTEEVKENEKTDITFGFSALSSAHGVIDPQPGDEVLEIELEADPGVTQSARLIGEDGKPVVGATIKNAYFNRFSNEHSFLNNENQPSGYTTGWGTNLKQDTFEVYLLEPGKPRLLVFLHQDQKLIGLTTATAGQPLSDVVMQHWGTVQGVVTDAVGKPLNDVKVKIDYPKRPAAGFWPEQPTATTDASGRFAIERLIPGRKHKLTIEAPENFVSKAESDIAPNAGEVVDVGEIQLIANP